MEAGEAVLQFLRSVGPSAEAEFYLQLFRSRPRESFATLLVDEPAMRDNADSVAVDLRFLNALSLTPVVVLGLQSPRRAAEHASRLEGLLHAAGLTTARHALDGDKQAVAADAACGRLPVVTAVDEGRDQALDRLAVLLDALQSHKLIFLRQRGGLRPHGERLNVVNLSTDYQALVAAGDLDSGDIALLNDARRLLFDRVSHRLLVTVTSPLNLLHELFTLKGAGTLLRKGVRILQTRGYDELDLPRLHTLLHSSFGRRPAPDFYRRPLSHAFVEENYRGAALVAHCPLGGYLTKFAVDREAQGEGIGQDLWNVLCAHYRSLLWRARPDNPIRAWYERICDGRLESAGWTVYLRGIDASQVPDAVAFALSQPIDF